MHTDTPGTQLPANCQFNNSSKDMGGRGAKKSQGTAVCSPQNCPQAVRKWQEGRLVRKDLSVILGLRELLKELRCLAKKKKKRERERGIKTIQACGRKNFSKQKYYGFVNNFTLGSAHKPRLLNFV